MISYSLLRVHTITKPVDSELVGFTQNGYRAILCHIAYGRFQSPTKVIVAVVAHVSPYYAA
jgi:hypothetical protein